MQKYKCIIATTTALQELHHHQINMITTYHSEILSDFLSFELDHIILAETRTQVRIKYVQKRISSFLPISQNASSYTIFFESSEPT